MSDRARIASLAGVMLDALDEQKPSVGEVAEACDYILNAIQNLTVETVMRKAYGDHPIVTSMFGFRNAKRAASAAPEGP